MNAIPCRLIRVVLVAVLPLGIAACGVKGPLEPPPYAAKQIQEQKKDNAEARRERQQARLTGAPPPPETGLRAGSTIPVSGTGGARGAGARSTARGTTSRPVTEAPAAKEDSVLDWLIK